MDDRVHASGFSAVTARGIDHVVAATRDLDAAAETWERLGFRPAPTARHPWGTENRVIQLAAGSFVELLAIGEGATLPEPTATAYSFGAWNRDFLARRGDGLSMLVLESKDEAADRADFVAAGLATFEPLGFDRIALTPDGEERRVGFDLTFADFRGAGAGAVPDLGFFTCRQRWPENFWNAERQRHPNTAIGIAAAILVAPDPSDFHEGLSAFAGVRAFRATSSGLVLETSRGAIEVLTPAACRWRYGAASLPTDPTTLAFVGLRFAVADFGEAASQLIAGGFAVMDRTDAFVVHDVGGATIAFEKAR